MPIDARKCCRMTDGHPSVNDFDALECAAAEIRYGNLDEALVYLTRAIPALEGLPPLVAKELACRETGRVET